MEKKFTPPEMEIIRFETEDIIVTSGGFTYGNQAPDAGNDDPTEINFPF
jgi:hypothetical protein